MHNDLDPHYTSYYFIPSTTFVALSVASFFASLFAILLLVTRVVEILRRARLERVGQRGAGVDRVSTTFRQVAGETSSSASPMNSAIAAVVMALSSSGAAFPQPGWRTSAARKQPFDRPCTKMRIDIGPTAQLRERIFSVERRQSSRTLGALADGLAATMTRRANQ